MRNKFILLWLPLFSSMFAWSANYNVTISTSNAEAGYVAINIPKGDVDGTTYFDTDEGGNIVSFTVASGRAITLTPTLNDADLYYFNGWSDGNTDNPRSVTVKKNLNLTANFAAYPVYTTTVTTASASQGSVSVTCLTKCVDENNNWAKVTEGGTVRIEAEAEEGYRFVRWDDDGADKTTAYRTITPTEDKTYTAVFEAIPVYTVTVQTNPENAGTVSASSYYAIESGDNYVKVEENHSVTIRANSNNEYRFVRWDDNGADNTSDYRTITPTEDKTYTAIYEKINYYRVEVQTADANMGSVSISASLTYGNSFESSGSNYYVIEEGKTVKIYAAPKNGYSFVRWDDAAEDNTSASRNIIANEDKVYTAYFEVKTSGSCGTNATWHYNAIDNSLVISGSGAIGGYNQNYNGSYIYSTPWEQFRLVTKKIIIGDEITSIGLYAFTSFPNLEEVYIGRSCTQFYTTPFTNDDINRYTSAKIITCYAPNAPDGMNIIDLDNVKKVIIPQAYESWIKVGGTTIENYEFLFEQNEYSGSCGTNLIWTVNLNNSTFVISGSGDMKSYNFAYQIPYTPYMKSVKSLTLSSSMTSISGSAFTQMSNLRLPLLEIPASITRIDGNPFPDAASTGLKAVYPKRATPPTLNTSTVFGAVDSFKVYLPIENYMAYTKANYWKQMQLEIIPQDVYSGSIGDSIQWSVSAQDSTLAIDGNGSVPDLNNTDSYPWWPLANLIKKVVIGENIKNIQGNYAFSKSVYDIRLVSNYSPHLFVEKGSGHYGYLAYMAQEVHNYATYTGSCGGNLTWSFNTEDSILTISGTGAMSYSVRPWTTYKNYIKTISLPNGITSICAGAFSGCTNLSEITLPASLETIEADAFAGCTNLKKVYNYSPYLVIVKGDWNNGDVGMYADEIYNMVEEYTGTCGANLTWKVNIRDSVLTISGTGAMAYYTSYAETPWYALSLYIKIAVIEEGVTNLSNKAFPDHYYNDDYSYKSYYIPQIVHNYSPLYISNGSGNVSDIFYIYYAQEIHNYYTRTGNCGDGLSWSYTDGVLTISGEGELDYTRYSSTPWHNYAIDTVVVLAEDVYVSDILFPTAAQIIIGENVHRITIGLGFDKVTALSDQTIISLISILWPFDETQYYDMDGNGDKEMMQIVSNRISGQNYFCDVNVYSTLTGTLVTDTLHPVTAYSSNFSMLYYLNANNDGKMDMVYYYQSTSGEPYKLELIESTNEGYVAKPIDALYSQTKKLPFFPLDANLDGRMDFYSCEGDYAHYIHYRQPDGSYMKVPLQIITDTAKLDDTTKQWMNSDAYLKGSYLFEITQGAYSMVGEIVKGPFQYMDTPIDINNDGLVDLLSSTKGALLLNIGNNRFIPSQAPGRVIPKDLNGDGILDYVLFDDETNTISIKIYTENGIVTKTLMQNANINHVWCYDFDKDGDMDILLPFDWNESSGYAYLVFFRNDGNNTFKKIENAFDEPIRHFYFYDCKDVDNDGKYEILALDSVQIHYSGIYNNNIEKPIYDGNSYIIHYDNNMNVSVDEQPLFANTIESQNLSISDATSYINSRGVYPLPLIADFNNDGALDYWYYYKGSSALSHFNPTNLNTAPQKMVTPSAILNDNQKMLTINWSRGSDLESPSADLTYNLRIGSSLGKGDVWFAAANADGKQRDILGGNVGGNVSQKVNTAAWETGDYYIAVQAVDPNGLGGAWSDELIYHHTAIPSQFEISDYEMTTADTLFVRLSTAINPDYTYNWNFGDSVVIIDQEGQNYLIAYKSSGNKIISLQVKSSEGVSSVTTTREVLVYPVRFEYSDKFSTTASRSYCDLNMDGYLDAFESRPKGPTGQLYSGGFYRGKDDGSFVKLAKTYNSDLSPYGTAEMCFIDYNMDGLPDVFHSSNKGNLFINEEEFDMSLETHEFKRNYYYGYNLRLDDLDPFYRSYGAQTGKSSMYDLIDYDRDGYLDGFFWGNNLHIYDTDTVDTWKQIQLPDDNPEWSNDNKYFADLNGDGLADVLVAADISEDHIVESTDDHDYRRWFGYNIYLQQTDGSIRKLSHITIGDETATIEDIADLNNDGYVDLIVIKNYKTIAIYLGDKDLLFKESVNITLSGERKITTRKSISAKRDLDNNGYPDLVSSDGFVIYIYPDFDFLCQSIPTNYTYPFIDLNGDGVPDFDDYYLRSRITNEAPAIPQNLHMIEENGAVKLMWDAAIDSETPAVQMRYNISIKKKNAQVGNEHAFIISPMNGLSDEAAVVPDYPYYRGTQTFIPYKRFELGQEYECQIQSIDAWNEHSPMSAPISFTVEKNTTYNPNQPTSLPIMEQEIVKPQKIMIDGVIYILRGDKTYTLQGQEVK